MPHRKRSGNSLADAQKTRFRQYQVDRYIGCTINQIIQTPAAINNTQISTVTCLTVATPLLAAIRILTADPLAFGPYDPTSEAPSDGSSTISVTCIRRTPYTVGLSAGTRAGATPTV
ncbi:spore coat protein U domain-containing protein [Lacibacterium aquatile]|uniref:Spore coat protein U domain-containing protein n=1 Tax=Lacibacterium aquatile TaxID=1168082 RepID=A0ABW5DTD6_9PROT